MTMVPPPGDTPATTPPSEQQLAEYRQADIGDWCEGPWTQDPVEGPEGQSGHFLVKDRDGHVVAMVPHWAGSIALFIAVARDAVPALLTEVDRRAREIELWRGAAEKLIGQRDAIELTVLDWENGKVTADSALKAIDRIIQGGAA